MQKAVASEVVATAHGLVVIGSKGPGTRVWFLPTKKAHASERLNEFMLPWEPPRGSPAALLPSGKLLVVGRDGASLTVEEGRSPQPGPMLGNVVVEGLSPEGVAFARGPRFFRYVDGAWRDEGAKTEDVRSVRAVEGELAVGADGDAWLGPAWKKLALKTKARLNCLSGPWIGGEGVVLERKGKTVKAHAVKGEVTAIAAWGKGVVMVVGGALVDLKGKAVKAPPELSGLSAHGGTLWCVSRGALFGTTDLKRWTKKALPKR
jgi:hypothetical protein